MSRILYIFGKEFCPRCDQAKKILSDHDIKYVYVDYIENGIYNTAYRDEMGAEVAMLDMSANDPELPIIIEIIAGNTVDSWSLEGLKDMILNKDVEK